MKRFSLMVIAMLVVASSAAYARDTYVMAYAPGDKNPTIEVVGLDDPGSPYYGKYSKLDRWAFDNFCYHVNDENYVMVQLSVPNIEHALKDRGIVLKITTHRSYVELDKAGQKGYLVPELAYLDQPSNLSEPQTLGEAALSHKSVEEVDQRPYFWSLGIEDEAAVAEHSAAVSAWLAPVYPAIPEWMVTMGHEGELYSFLPDGGVVISDPDVKDDFSKRDSHITRYDAGGNVLKQADGDYMSWERLMLNDVKLEPGSPYFVKQEHTEASGRSTGASNNILGTGRYQTYRNAERDGFLAVIDYWQGKVLTPADGDLTKLTVDPYPYFGRVDYAEVARVYQAQQALAKAGKT
jgi:hypothetical protein